MKDIKEIDKIEKRKKKDIEFPTRSEEERLKKVKVRTIEPNHNQIIKTATMSDDSKSLIVRIPQEIRNKFNLKKGNKLKFIGDFEEGKSPKLSIELEV